MIAASALTRVFGRRTAVDSVTFEVRCSHCHTVSDDLKDGSFDSDEKEVKQKTRELLKLIYDSKR